MTIALLRYLADDVLRSQRWVAPALVFLAGVALFNVSGGPLLTTYADTAAVLLPVSAWLAVTVANAEDPTQAGVTAVAVGGPLRLRVAKLLTALAGTGVATVVALAWPLVAGSYTGRASVGDVAAGAGAHLLVALFGVSLGSLGMRGVLPRPGWMVLVAAAGCLGEVLVPHAPPTRRVLELFDRGAVGGLAAVAVETAVLVAALAGVSLAVARYRD